MNKTVKQHDITDCASACIASVARHYGRFIPLAIIREASGTTASGTSVKGITDACLQLGLEAQAYISDSKDISVLKEIPLPVILHVLTEEGDLHFIVLYEVRRDNAKVMDPASGTMRSIPLGKLKNMWSGCLIAVKPGTQSAAMYPDGKEGRSIFRYARFLSKKEFISMLAASAAYTVAGICISLFLQHIIDKVLPSGDHRMLFTAGAVMLSLMGLALAVGYERIRFSLKVNVRMDGGLMLGYLHHLLHLPVAFFSHRGAGELHSRLEDASRIRAFLTDGTVSALTGIMLVTGSFALMFTFHWRLALFVLMFIPVYLGLYVVADRVSRRVNRDIIESSAAFEERVVEGIGAARTIRHFSSEGYVLRNIEAKYADLALKLYNGGKKLGACATAADATAKILSVSLLTVGSLFIFDGSLSVGELVSFYSLTAFFSSPLSQLTELNSRLAEARIAAERLEDITSQPIDKPGPSCMGEPCSGDIVFEKLSFSYPGCPELLNGFNAVIPQGKITAIQGESGCGKSSLAALLMRDYAPSSGKILLGGTDISLYGIDDWLRFVSIVPQDPEMLDRSILDNVSCLEKSPDVKKIATLLDELGMHDFITSLPLGLLTPAGSKGCALSGGQRQRIALARALYRDPQLLILDEATSSLDKVAQDFVLKKIESLRKEGITIVMITHKNENAAIADLTIRL